jgi:hypothetical protein
MILAGPWVMPRSTWTSSDDWSVSPEVPRGRLDPSFKDWLRLPNVATNDIR